MPERRRSRRPRWVIVIVCVALMALVILIAVVGGQVLPAADEESSSGTGVPPEPTSTADPTEPALPPVRVGESAWLTVPEDVTTARGEFALEQGRAYVVTVDIATEKPADSLGVNIFLGVRLTCADAKGSQMGTAGGTENLRTGERVTLSNQLLLRPSNDGIHHCEVFLNAPNDEGASAGTAFELDVAWTVTPVEGFATQTPAVERLPMTIPPGAREMTFGEVVSLGDLTQDHLQMHASLNLTTCTAAGGSREDGRTWCSEEDIDTDGSVYEVETRMDVIGDDGAVCGAIDVSKETVHLEHYTHHQLLHVERYVEIPSTLCGDRVRIAVMVDNSGPASLVVHRANSSMITTETQVPR